MKNIFTFAFILVMIVAATLGCGNPFSGSQEPANTSSKDKTLTDKGVDVTVGRSKIGVPECDEVMDSIEAELNNSEDDFVTKAIKATVLNRIKDSIKESVEKNNEKNKQDTVELAKTCKEFKTQFDKYKAEEEAKKSE